LPNQGQKRGTKEQDESKGPILTPTATAASVIRRMEIDKHPAAACKKAAENGPDVCSRCGRDQLELIKRRGYYPSGGFSWLKNPPLSSSTAIDIQFKVDTFKVHNLYRYDAVRVAFKLKLIDSQPPLFRHKQQLR
jgi:hypothetical protein